jgi:hypothetical protein
VDVSPKVFNVHETLDLCGNDRLTLIDFLGCFAEQPYGPTLFGPRVAMPRFETQTGDEDREDEGQNLVYRYAFGMAFALGFAFGGSSIDFRPHRFFDVNGSRRIA